MKVLPLSKLKFNNITFQSGRINDCAQLRYLDNEVPADIQLYRCIGECEYQKLINGETILSSGYATSNPKGWDAKGWNDGFISSGRDSYFITFKINRFNSIIDERYDEADTRYRIVGGYSLADIFNIRKGRNIHGEIVWAEDFEKTKLKDVLEKTQIIDWLIMLIKSNNSRFDKKEIKDELLSYGEEFPQINVWV